MANFNRSRSDAGPLVTVSTDGRPTIFKIRIHRQKLNFFLNFANEMLQLLNISFKDENWISFQNRHQLWTKYQNMHVQGEQNRMNI